MKSLEPLTKEQGLISQVLDALVLTIEKPEADKGLLGQFKKQAEQTGMIYFFEYRTIERSWQ